MYIYRLNRTFVVVAIRIVITGTNFLYIRININYHMSSSKNPSVT